MAWIWKGRLTSAWQPATIGYILDNPKYRGQRIALVDPTLLAMNKLAVNQVYDSMGLKSVFDAANALDTISHTSKASQDFYKTSREHGFKTALTENEKPFRDSPQVLRGTVS